MAGHFDAFFRANYLRMVRYCASFGFREPDAEEVVADVIHKHYDDYRERIESPNVDTVLRQWMNRRALLDLRTLYSRDAVSKTGPLLGDAEGVHFDDPESLLDLKQRTPPVHPILISYQPFGVREPRVKGGAPKGANTSADKTRFCRERKKFLAALSAGPSAV